MESRPKWQLRRLARQDVDEVVDPLAGLPDGDWWLVGGNLID